MHYGLWASDLWRQIKCWSTSFAQILLTLLNKKIRISMSKDRCPDKPLLYQSDNNQFSQKGTPTGRCFVLEIDLNCPMNLTSNDLLESFFALEMDLLSRQVHQCKLACLGVISFRRHDICWWQRNILMLYIPTQYVGQIEDNKCIMYAAVIHMSEDYVSRSEEHTSELQSR